MLALVELTSDRLDKVSCSRPGLPATHSAG